MFQRGQTACMKNFNISFPKLKLSARLDSPVVFNLLGQHLFVGKVPTGVVCTGVCVVYECQIRHGSVQLQY